MIVPLLDVKERVPYGFIDQDFFLDEEWAPIMEDYDQEVEETTAAWTKRKIDNDLAGKRTNRMKEVEKTVRRGTDPAEFPKYDVIIRTILGLTGIRSCRWMHPVRGELEISTYSRDALTVDSPTLSLPNMQFIDGFGAHRNMYRSLMGKYLIPANITLRERT